MRNEDLIKYMDEKLDGRVCQEHSDAIHNIRDDINAIKVEIAKIVTAYKVFIAIGSAIGVVIGFFVELFYKSS